MSKIYQAHICAYGSLSLEASKYSETRYNKVISTVTHKSKNT